MSLREKTDALFEAAGSSKTIPDEMKSMIVELKQDITEASISLRR